ncbi:MAG: type 1 glutamine amidotransferase [Gammaproteobacteria bacterium]|nr:type 1 glutamine amidotransferase [Gammaproteobacteria bacterium]
MKLAGKKIALFLAEYYEDLEFWYPRYRMMEEGAEIVVISVEIKTYRSKHGLPAKANRVICDVTPEEFDALIIPGGYAPDHMRRSPEMLRFTYAIHQQEKLVAAICHGPWVLVSAGILKNKKATSFYSIKDDLTNAGAEWVDEPVVRDGMLITSRRPGDLPDFCRTIIDTLASR